MQRMMQRGRDHGVQGLEFSHGPAKHVRDRVEWLRGPDAKNFSSTRFWLLSPEHLRIVTVSLEVADHPATLSNCVSSLRLMRLIHGVSFLLLTEEKDCYLILSHLLPHSSTAPPLDVLRRLSLRNEEGHGKWCRVCGAGICTYNAGIVRSHASKRLSQVDFRLSDHLISADKFGFQTNFSWRIPSRCVQRVA